MCDNATFIADYADQDDSPVWTLSAIPACTACGANQRGDTEDCFLCSITRRANLGKFEILSRDTVDGTYKPEMKENPTGYKGGEGPLAAKQYLWQAPKQNLPGGFFDRFTGECGEVARIQAKGTPSSVGQPQPLDCYKGGMSLKDCCAYLSGGALPQSK